MNKHQDYWNKKYSDDLEYKKINKPSDFVKFAEHYLLKQGTILELGAGTGQDTKYLFQKGFYITATDFSQVALNNLRKNFNSLDHVTIKELDLSKPFSEATNHYDAVLANLVVHYFDSKTTQQIFKEIYRVLKLGGILALMVNTKTDSEYGMGKKLSEDFFELELGRPKRYFSISTLQSFTKQLQTVLLDDKGLDSRRADKKNLIRFIGKKL